MPLFRRVLAFAGLPFISLITPFLFLPILARVAGAEAWLAIAVGQSVGAFAALFVAFGYNTVGPTVVALEPTNLRPAVLARSVRPRLALFVPAVVTAALVASFVAPTAHRIDATLMAVALTLSGLSSAWYMIGLGRAGLIVLYELVPRVVATVGAAAALLLVGQVTWYPILLIVAALLGPGAFVVRTIGLRGLLDYEPGAVRREMASNRSVFATEVASGAYNTLAVTFVSIVAPTLQAASYVSGDKLYRVGQYSVSALGNALQGWAVEDARRDFSARARTALILHGALGLAGFAAFATLGPWLTGLLFGATVSINVGTALGLGAATLGIALGTALGRVILIGIGARRQFMVSVVVGALVGVPAVILLAAEFGAAGGAWGLALGEATSVALQVHFVWRRWPKSGHGSRN